ncbi:MAG TPA: type IV pilus modification protein PilV [Gammaproteobacteria bacterium]|nr:type IV pilus modification protein PilV [Gammaproteobacteria bacterium]
MMNSRKRNTGFSLIEVLIALVILSVGLLGLAGLQTSSLHANDGAYLRTQANVLAYNLFDRMRANISEAKGKAYDRLLTDPAPTNPPVCIPTADTPIPDCTPAQLVQWDMSQWLKQVAKLPDGKASVSTDTSGINTVVTVTLNWLQRGLEHNEDDSTAKLVVTTAF